MSSSLRPIKGQHTVTGRILKEFGDKQGKLAVFDVSRGLRHCLAPGAGIFKTQFDKFDSRGAEDRWNRLETHFPAALARVRNRSALDDPKTIATLKDMLALHWARSIAILVARERVMAQSITEQKQRLVRTRPDMLVRALREELGLVASSTAELEWLSDQVHERVVAANEARWHSQRDPVNFAEARSYFDELEVQIAHTNGRDLLISDCPVISTQPGVIGTGPHHGIGIKSADNVAMPIGPNVLIGLGPTQELLEMTDDHVKQYNRWQWEACVFWIAARPDGSADDSIKLAVQLASKSRSSEVGR